MRFERLALVSKLILGVLSDISISEFAHNAHFGQKVD